jgi:hypothetical protein
MKWWYVVVLIVGVGIGWWILKNYGIKKETYSGVVEESTVQKEVAKLPTIIISDNKGKKVEAVAVDGGIVQKWSPETGEIEFMREGKLWKLTVDPAVATIFVPSLKNETQVLMVKEKSGLRWQTAFCKGDFVSIRLNEGRVVFIDNSGYRSCGFKGE